MSRIEYGEADDTASFLRCCAFSANTERHLNGKKGQAALKELEAALLALPEKRLESSRFVVVDGEKSEGSVCALGALALKRLMDTGLSRKEAMKKLDESGPRETHGWEGVQETAKFLNVKDNFAWEVIEQNDECGGPTCEERYERVLEWVQKRIVR
jgi:hypothetical protein